MTRLADLARVVRSKNAGPTMLTIDILFAEVASFERAAPVLTAARISEIYAVEASVIVYRPALAIKIVMPRGLIAGDPGDRDVYGAQQHAPLLDLDI